MARFFHVIEGDSVKIGKRVFKKHTSHRITNEVSIPLFDLANNGVVALTEFPISFDEIKEAKREEKARAVVFDKEKTKKDREKEEKEKEAKEKEKEEKEKDYEDDAVFDPVVEESVTSKKKK